MKPSQPIAGYEILEQVGAGGMSSVYKARHKGLEKFVAVKVLRRDQIDPGLALARLTKEARVLSRLDHPAIVRSIDFGESGDLVYFVMELVDGQSCKQLLIDRGPFPLREVLLIGERVAEALGHAAAHGVTHRDVKPGNILLGKDGSVKLTDFGLARATRDRSLTQDGITVGTPQYMSPEQVRSPRRVDLRSDLYSLGATLYHLTTGHPPLRGETVGEILHEVLYAVPKPPEQLIPGLPPGFSRLLARLLAKDPKRRYGSAEELIADLQRVRAAFTDPEADLEVGLSWQEAAEPPPKARLGLPIVSVAAVVAVVALVVLGRGDGDAGPDLRDAKVREELVIAQLSDDWKAGKRSSADVLARLGELKRDGQLTFLSSLPRTDLRSEAQAKLESEVGDAAVRGVAAAWSALARGDFASAHRALDAELDAAIEEAVPDAVRDGLAAGDVDPAPWIAAARARAYGELDRLEQELRRRVRQALLLTRAELDERVQGALEQQRWADARALLEGHPARERVACLDATRSTLNAAGVALDKELPDDGWPRGWPEAVRAEVEREPAASFVANYDELLSGRVARASRDLLFAVQEAERRAQDELQAGREVDLAALRAAVEADGAATRAGLAAIGVALPDLDAAWRAIEEQVAAARRQLQAEREAVARAALLDGATGRPGIVGLLSDRRIEEARAALAQHGDLAEGDRAAWTRATDDLAALLTQAIVELRAREGQDVELRDRHGVGVRGKLAFESGTTFAVGARRKIVVEELALASLDRALQAAVPDEPRRLVVRFLLGDAKERAALSAALDAAAGDPVVDALRRTLLDQALTDAARKEQREGDALLRRGQLDAALAGGDAPAARSALRQLQLLSDTAAGRAALAERAKLEAAIDAVERGRRTRALLEKVAPHAAERTVEADGSVTVAWSFDRADEGKEWNVSGNAVRVENGRLWFVGGESGGTGELYGATLEWPFDRKAAATMTIKLMPGLGEKLDPHYVGLRFGPACAAFFRPDEPKGEHYDPQLAAWLGTLDEKERAVRFFDPAYDQTEPATGRVTKAGLERGRSHVVVVSWLPDPGNGTVTVGVTLDGDRVHEVQERLVAAKGRDVVQLRSLTELQIESVVLRGRLVP